MRTYTLGAGQFVKVILKVMMLQGTTRSDDLQRNTALQYWNNVMTIRNNVATMLQRCVALKIVVANRPVQHHLKCFRRARIHGKRRKECQIPQSVLYPLQSPLQPFFGCHTTLPGALRDIQKNGREGDYYPSQLQKNRSLVKITNVTMRGVGGFR